MTGTGMTGTGALPPGAAAAVEDYLAEVDRRLPGGARTRRDAIDELRDGLVELLEQRPPVSHHQLAPLVVREFGDPATVGAALADELRLRLARRNAIFVLLLLAAAGAGWQVYYLLAGMPAAMVPTGWTRPVFLASVDLLKVFATIAQVATALLAVSLTIRAPWLAASRLPVWLAVAALAAIAAFVGAVLLGVATAAPGHVAFAALLCVPVAGVMLLAARSAYRALQHVRAQPA